MDKRDSVKDKEEWIMRPEMSNRYAQYSLLQEEYYRDES